MSLFFLLAGNITSFTSSVEQNLMIHASIDNIKTQEDIDKMSEDIKKMSGVKQITFSSKEEEINSLIGDNSQVFERYKESNPMPNAFIIELQDAKDIPSVTKKLNEIEGIDKAQYGGESIENIVKLLRTIQNGGAIFIVFLTLLAVFLIANTIKMTIYTRSTEIAIMRNVGATNWYIKAPFMLEGMFIGMIGAIVPIALTCFGYTYLYIEMSGHFLTNMFIMQQPEPFVLQISLVLLICGALVGCIGSFFSVTKYLRWKR